MVNSVLSEGHGVPSRDDLHVHGAVTEDEAEQIPEDLECRISFLLIGSVGFQKISDPVISEELLQGSFNFSRFILVNPYYAYHGKSVLWYVVWWCLHHNMFSRLLPLFCNVFSCFLLGSYRVFKDRFTLFIIFLFAEQINQRIQSGGNEA